MMEAVSDWLGDADRVAELGRRLRDSGVPADRIGLFRRTLHPDILARATLWAPNGPIEIFDREHGLDLSIRFAGSPLDHAMIDGASRTLRRSDWERSAWKWAEPFRGLGLAVLVVKPLPRGAALVIGTRAAAGFTDSNRAALDRLAGSAGEKPSGFR